MTKILCIDQGISNIGISIIDDKLKIYHLETFNTSNKSEIGIRYKEIFDYLNQTIKKYKIDVIAYEHPVMNSQVGHVLSGVVAITHLCATLSKIDIIGYAANTVKKKSTGNGKASKKDVENKIKTLYNMDEFARSKHSDHVYDSLAVGYTYLCSNISKN